MDLVWKLASIFRKKKQVEEVLVRKPPKLVVHYRSKGFELYTRQDAA